MHLNPKRPELFGQLDTRGGAAAAHFRERRLELPNFHFCPQSVLWKLVSSAKIWDPIEVAEVKI